VQLCKESLELDSGAPDKIILTPQPHPACDTFEFPQIRTQVTWSKSSAPNTYFPNTEPEGLKEPEADM